MKKYLISSLVLALMVAVVLPTLLSGVVWGKAHVPANQVQVSHKGKIVKQLPAQALGGHLRHGDIQLPACDFANVFQEGDDSSNVISADFTGVTYSDVGFVARVDAGGLTPACPPGAF
ncbi:MAG: hypothetical protein ACE5Q6_17265 [Dehalococcoidia bacterium]